MTADFYGLTSFCVAQYVRSSQDAARVTSYAYLRRMVSWPQSCPVGMDVKIAVAPFVIWLTLPFLVLGKGRINLLQYLVSGCRQLSAGLLINREVQRDRLQAAPSYFMTFHSLRAAAALASQCLGRIYSYSSCGFIVLCLHIRLLLDCTS